MTKEDLVKFLNINIRNINGKLESQRLKEKWLLKNGFKNEYIFLKNHNILPDKDGNKKLYMFIFNETDKCECGTIKRYKGFDYGFQDYCEKCGRTKKCYMSSDIHSTLDLNLNEIINFVKDINGNYSTTKIKKLSNKTLDIINERTKYLMENSKISEKLFHIEYNLYELPKCKYCGKPHNNFKFSNNGYHNCCKGPCSYKYKTPELKILQHKKHLEKRYKILLDRYKSDDNYEINLFSIDEWLESQDSVIKFKHLKCGHEYERNVNYQGHLKCPLCFPIRSKQQYLIFDWLKNIKDCIFNDRKFIRPNELDILCDDFAIEYDSLIFHSYGKSTMKKFNNINEYKRCHLYKTELCESKNIQLYRIFSNEWFNKEQIWKSVINSKAGNVKKLYARKCSIKEISNSEYKSFCENNHLQGYGLASIKIGLFYQEELVSLMSFGKSRYSKNIEYELIRFCSKLNTQVIGGASRLLKYFERIYQPKSIISYANRRWSQGSLYETLGFEFSHNSEPNYFYFKGGDKSELYSRVQFQKHKLKDKLEIYDSKLSETENMFNNGYRKIYDCGNKVYIKNY